MRRRAQRVVGVLLLLLVLVVWVGYAFDVAPESLNGGCTYSSGECGDPAPGNFPAAPGN